MSYHFATASVV